MEAMLKLHYLLPGLDTNLPVTTVGDGKLQQLFAAGSTA